MTIKEMANRDLPEIITGNGWNDWDKNEVKRKGYILGANAVLKEIEQVLYTTRYFNDTKIDKLKELVEQLNKR